MQAAIWIQLAACFFYSIENVEAAGLLIKATLSLHSTKDAQHFSYGDAKNIQYFSNAVDKYRQVFDYLDTLLLQLYPHLGHQAFLPLNLDDEFINGSILDFKELCQLVYMPFVKNYMEDFLEWCKIDVPRNIEIKWNDLHLFSGVVWCLDKMRSLLKDKELLVRLQAELHFADSSELHEFLITFKTVLSIFKIYSPKWSNLLALSRYEEQAQQFQSFLKQSKSLIHSGHDEILVKAYLMWQHLCTINEAAESLKGRCIYENDMQNSLSADKTAAFHKIDQFNNYFKFFIGACERFESKLADLIKLKSALNEINPINLSKI